MAERMLIGLSLLLIIKAPAVVVVGMWDVEIFTAGYGAGF